MKLKSMILAAALSLAACATPKYQDPYADFTETEAQRKARLGDTPEVCEELFPGHNYVFDKRINLVFVGVNETETELKFDAREFVAGSEFMKGLLEYEPYASSQDAFNFWYVTETEHVKKRKSGLRADGSESTEPIKRLGSICEFPRKAVVGVVDWKFVSSAFMPHFSGLNLNALNLKDIGSIQEKLSQYTWEDCYMSRKFCDFIDINGNVREDLSPEEIKELCSMFKYREDCIVDFKYGMAEGYKLAVAAKAMEYHAVEFCGALGEVGSHDKRACDIISDDGDIPLSFLWLSTIELHHNYSWVLPHELGHVFGLDEEYYDPEVTYEGMGVNCFPAPTKEACIKDAPWADMVGVHEGIGCYTGCAGVKEINGMPVWKSYDNGVMECYTKKGYGAWNEKHLCSVIYAATQKMSEFCKEFF